MAFFLIGFPSSQSFNYCNNQFIIPDTGGGSASTKVAWGKFSKHSSSKTIGRIRKNGTVKRGSSEEAVIGIKVQPISTLIRFAKLRTIFEAALSAYVAELQDVSRKWRWWLITTTYRSTKGYSFP